MGCSPQDIKYTQELAHWYKIAKTKFKSEFNHRVKCLLNGFDDASVERGTNCGGRWHHYLQIFDLIQVALQWQS